MGVDAHLNRVTAKPFGTFLEDKMDSYQGPVWTADKSLWLTADGELTDDRDEGVTLVCRQGMGLPMHLAQRYGLIEGKRPEGVTVHAAALSGVNLTDTLQPNTQGFKQGNVVAEGHPAFTHMQKGAPPKGTVAAERQQQEREEQEQREPPAPQSEGALNTANTAEGESAAATAPDKVEEMEDAKGMPEGVRTKTKAHAKKDEE